MVINFITQLLLIIAVDYVQPSIPGDIWGRDCSAILIDDWLNNPITNLGKRVVDMGATATT